jgi:hypothetical protein
MGIALNLRVVMLVGRLKKVEDVSKDLFNRKEHKEGAKHTKLNQCISILCDLCENPLWPLWLMDFDF